VYLVRYLQNLLENGPKWNFTTSFVLANKTKDNAPWQAITPIYAPVIKADNEPTSSRFELIQQGFARVFDESMVDGDSGWKVVE